MAYNNPAISTNKMNYDQDIIVEEDYSTILSGPVTVPNANITGGTLTIAGDFYITGNLVITDTNNSIGILNTIG